MPAISFSDLLSSGADAVRRAQSLGVGRFGRFVRYLSHLEDLRSAEFSIEDDLAAEALHQLYHLQRSVALWTTVDRAVLTDKLERIFRGTELPPRGNEHDDPRNTLFELAVAGMLKAKGLTVSLPDPYPDILAFDRVKRHTLRIECKRPSDAGRPLETALKKARSSAVENRRFRRPGFGIVAIEVDRMSESTGCFLFARTPEGGDAQLVAARDEVQRRLIGRLRTRALALSPLIVTVLLVQMPVIGLANNAICTPEAITQVPVLGCERVNDQLAKILSRPPKIS